MRSHKELRYKIEEFLLFGIDADQEEEDRLDARSFFRKSTYISEAEVASSSACYDDDASARSRRQFLSDLQQHCNAFLFEIDQQSPEKATLPNEVHKVKLQIEHLQKEGRETEVMQALQSYLRKKHHLQLLTLSNTMQKLDTCSNIIEIPNLILGVKESMPKVLVEGSKIKQLVQTVVQKVRTRLLKKFHEFFEEQLNDEVNAMDSYENGNQNRAKMWEVFLRRSRDWLLAFALVSILPYTLTQSPNYVLEKFQEALDEALTPIWGRFYHHLKMAREAQSANQIIWTFNYARSFIEMLINLSSQITQSEPLKELCDLNYFEAARSQILEKSLKFLRAHMAQIVTDAIRDPSFLLHLIEEGIEFDVWIRSLAAVSGLCTVVYESKETFHRWLAHEQSLIYRQLEQTLDNPFELAFASEVQENRKSLRCYRSIYNVMSLLVQLRVRYQNFPPTAQLILAEVIVEPLVCFSLGLLLYKIRSDAVLYNISIANYNQSLEDFTALDSLRVFCDTVSYFQTALGSSGQPKMVADSKRCKKRWTIVQNWMPKIFIAKTQQQQGFSLLDLLRTALKISDRFQSKTFDYRSEWQQRKDEVDTIDECVVMARGLAITLVDVLERQLTALSTTSP